MINSFLAQVAADLIRRAGGIQYLSNYTIIFPMSRAGLFLRKHLMDYFSQQTEVKTILLPEFTTIDAFADSLCELQPDDEIRSIVELYHIFNRVTNEKLPFDVFYGWGSQLLNDFSNVDMAMLDPKQLFANSVDAHRLEDLALDEEVLKQLMNIFSPNPRHAEEADSIRRRFEVLWQAIPEVYEAFHEVQQKAGIGYRGARTRWVVEHFDDEYVQRRIHGRSFAFVGFNYLLTAEKELMRKLQRSTAASAADAQLPTSFLTYWDYRPNFTTNSKVYEFIKKHIDDGFPNALEVVEPQVVILKGADGEPVKPKQNVQVVSTSSVTAQVHYVNDWLVRHHQPGQQTAIVIADESMLEPVLYALPATFVQNADGKSNVNITKGFPLRSTRVFAEINKYLQDGKHDKKPEETYADVLRRMMQHLTQEVKNQLPPLRIKEEKETDNQGVNWQPALLAESYYQAQLVITRLINMIDTGVLSDVTLLRTLRNIVRRMLERVTIPFHGEPIAEIQIIGVLETRLLDFDNVLVLNVEEGVLPRVPADNSFIPYYLRKFYHMQTSEEEASIYAYNFFRLLRRAEHVSLLFTNSTSGTSMRSMSRFVMQILASDEFTAERFLINENPNSQHRDVCLLEPTTTFQGSSISPSAISTYLSCPRKFYYEKVLRLREVKNGEELFASNDTGSLIHSFIQAAYITIANGRYPAVITQDEIDDFLNDEDRVQAALLKAFDIMNKDYEKFNGEQAEPHFKPEEHTLEAKVARKHMEKVLRYDAQHPFTLLGMEMKMYAEVPVLLDDGTLKNVRVGGDIDRLDVVSAPDADGTNQQERLRVLDYKTGGYKSGKMTASDIASVYSNTDKRYVLQTLLYCNAVRYNQQPDKEPLLKGRENLPVFPMLLFTTKDLDKFEPRLKLGGKQLTDFANWEQRNEFEKLLEATLKSILSDTTFPMCDDAKCPDYCPFRSLCGK